MGRQSLSGKPLRLRTVDDDLAASNLTRQDIADSGHYSFKRVWSHLKKQGWHAKTGGPLSYDHFYIKPGKDIERDVEGLDFFYGEASLVQYARAVGLFTSDSAADSQSQPPSTPTEPVSTPTIATAHPTPSSAETMSSNGSAHPQKLKTSAMKSTVKVKKESKPTPPKIQRRQWPASHPSKGRHADDAISLASDDDGDDEHEDTKRHVKTGAATNPPALGKRRSLRVVDDDFDEEEDEGGAENGAGDHDESNQRDDGVDLDDQDENASMGTASFESVSEDESSSDNETASTGSAKGNGKRPLLRTRVPKKLKTTTTATTATGKRKYKPSPSSRVPYALKIKTVGRGIMAQPNSSFETHGRIALEESPPSSLKKRRRDPPDLPNGARPSAPHHTASSAKPKAAHGLGAAFDSVEVKQEPATAVFTSPPRPPSRASSVASSHTSSSAPRQSVPTILLDVHGVVFSSCPTEKYHVVVSQSVDLAETTILMEEATSAEQRTITFPDITKFGDPAQHNLTADEITQALLHTLMEIGDKVVIGPPVPPPEEPKPDPELLAVLGITGNAAVMRPKVSMVDFTRDDDAAGKLVLFFPITITITAVKHRFPMAIVPEIRRVQDLKKELQQKTEELEAVKRDMEAFRKQHKMIEREYQKLRTAAAADRKKTRPATTANSPTTESAAPGSATSSPARAVAATTSKLSRSFHAHTTYLATAFPQSPESASELIRPVAWDDIVDCSAEHFRIARNEMGLMTSVTANVRGSYQLNMHVTHETTRQLVVTVVPAAESGERLVHPTVVQVFQLGDTKKRLSRIDRIVHLNVNDTLTVQLRTRRGVEEMADHVMWLPDSTMTGNVWMVHFLDKVFLNQQDANGAAASH